MLRTLGRPLVWAFGRFGDSRRRVHAALLVAGALSTAIGLLAYALVAPEVPFAQAPVKLIRDLAVDDLVKIYGRIECNCSKAIDREESRVGATGRNWNATFAAFTVNDPSGKIWINTDAVTRLTPGPTGGDWKDGDWIAVYGTVYDQGNGIFALRAQMIAKTVDDTPAVWAFHLLVATSLGAIAIAYVLTDRLIFGAPQP